MIATLVIIIGVDELKSGLYESMDRKWVKVCLTK